MKDKKHLYGLWLLVILLFLPENRAFIHFSNGIRERLVYLISYTFMVAVILDYITQYIKLQTTYRHFKKLDEAEEMIKGSNYGYYTVALLIASSTLLAFLDDPGTRLITAIILYTTKDSLFSDFLLVGKGYFLHSDGEVPLEEITAYRVANRGVFLKGMSKTITLLLKSGDEIELNKKFLNDGDLDAVLNVLVGRGIGER
jgi:hypothetical protein